LGGRSVEISGRFRFSLNREPPRGRQKSRSKDIKDCEDIKDFKDESTWVLYALFVDRNP